MLGWGCRMELTYRLTRQDHQQFCQLSLKRAASHAKGLLGWKAAPVVLSLASMVLTLFVLDYLFSKHVIDDRVCGSSACLPLGPDRHAALRMVLAAPILDQLAA